MKSSRIPSHAGRIVGEVREGMANDGVSDRDTGGYSGGKKRRTPSCGSRSNVSSVLGTCQGYGSSSVALLRLWRLLEPSESFAGCGLIAAFRLRAPRADPAGQCADNSV